MAIQRLVRPTLLLAGGALTIVMTAACQGNFNANGNWSEPPTTSAAAAIGGATTAAPSTTSEATSATESASTPVYVQTFDPNATVQNPKELDFYENTEMDGITWSSWGGDTAQGNGVLSDNDCTPDCASGHPDTYSAHIVLSDIQTVNGTREYTHYTVTFDGQAQHPELAQALTDQQIKPS
jgi:hypothetical protein